MKTRSKGLIFFLAMLAAVSLYFLIDRMIIGRDRYFHSGYADKAYVELMEKMIGDGVFKIHGSEIIIDENVLNEKNLREKIKERVRSGIPFLYIRNGGIFFDRQSVSITNNRVFADERIVRGRFLDRNSDVLAESIIDEKTWKQERRYLYGPEFYHIIGHWNQVFGKRNLEKELDEYLTGKTHSPVYRKTSDPLKSLQLGDDIILTLDKNIQKSIFVQMKGKRGAVVVLDIKTGEILGAAGMPSFDPNAKEKELWREAIADTEDRPFENRAFSTLYPPGSTFKTVVASAWIEKDKKDPSQKDYKVFCAAKKNKYGISDIHAHGKTDFDKAYSESCNIFFSEIGVMLGKDLLDYSNRFGFNRNINLISQIKGHSFNAEASRAFSWNEDKRNDFKAFGALDFKRNPKLIAQGAIGQNLISATPLQMALVASIIANKGVLLNPYIVKEIRTGDGAKALFSAKPIENGRTVKEKTAAEIRKLMGDVMQSGTGKDVKKIYFENGKYYSGPKAGGKGKMIPVAGKTGTAEVGDRNGNGKIDPDEKPHSWFIGFAPADNPRFAIAVIAENQGFGSLTAAPIAVEVLAEALNGDKKR